MGVELQGWVYAVLEVRWNRERRWRDGEMEMEWLDDEKMTTWG